MHHSYHGPCARLTGKHLILSPNTITFGVLLECPNPQFWVTSEGEGIRKEPAINALRRLVLQKLPRNLSTRSTKSLRRFCLAGGDVSESSYAPRLHRSNIHFPHPHTRDGLDSHGGELLRREGGRAGFRLSLSYVSLFVIFSACLLAYFVGWTSGATRKPAV